MYYFREPSSETNVAKSCNYGAQGLEMSYSRASTIGKSVWALVGTRIFHLRILESNLFNFNSRGDSSAHRLEAFSSTVVGVASSQSLLPHSFSDFSYTRKVK